MNFFPGCFEVRLLVYWYQAIPAIGTFGMLHTNNIFIIGCRCFRVVVFISGTSSELLVTGTSFRIVKKVFTIWCWTCMMDLHSHCFEIEYICFGLVCLILQRNSIALHLVVYFGKVDDLFERECFSHYNPKKLPETVSLSVQFQLCVNEFFSK